MDYKVKRRELYFYREWRGNNARIMHQYKALNIICIEKWQIHFCIDRLREIIPLAEVVEVSDASKVSHLNPILIRWELSSSARILSERACATAADEIRSFDEVFEVLRADFNLSNPLNPKEESNDFPISIDESETTIIHSKINYNVIQGES